jgi:N-methylhydantoinase A
VRRRLDVLPEFRERPTTLAYPVSVPVRVGNATVAATMISAVALAPGMAVTGPALVEGYSSSLWVPPGWSALRDEHGNIIMRSAAA